MTPRGVVKVHFFLHRQALGIMNQQPPTFSQKYILLANQPRNYHIFHRLNLDFDFGNDDPTELDGHINLKKLANTQTVLLARTSLTEGPSGLTSFDILRSESLPLKRTDVNTRDNMEVTRVSLASAVQCIVDLEMSEDSASQVLSES